MQQILSNDFLAEIQPALDDARGDEGHDLHEVALAVESPEHKHYANGRPFPYAVTIDISAHAVAALVNEAKWRYAAWDGADNRCIQEHYNRFVTSLGGTPQRLG